MKGIFLSTSSVLIVACAADRGTGDLFGPPEEGTLVVDVLLIVAHPLPDLFLHQTVSPGREYHREMAAVFGAEVVIRQGDQIFSYQADPRFGGSLRSLRRTADGIAEYGVRPCGEC